jgi:uncharacterized phage-associated protein
MFVDRSREKLINAIVYFSKYAECSKTKLLKLLYLADFEHFRETGRSITGLNYYAWKLGPVPTKLYAEFEDPEADFSNAIAIKPAEFNGTAGVVAVPKVEFNAGIFTGRELKVLETIAREHGRKTAGALVELTHKQGSPWHKVYTPEADNERIPYELALEGSPDKDRLLEAKRERDDFLAAWTA